MLYELPGSKNTDQLKGCPVEGNSAFADALMDSDLEIPSGVTGPDGGSAQKRFAVYRNNVIVSLTEALGDAYPSTKAILGEEQFHRIARYYLAKHPPKSAMMHGFGESFPDFLAGFPPLAKSKFLVDLAMLERAWLESHHAVDDPILESGKLGAIPPEQLVSTRFIVHPAARLFSSQFPILDLFLRRHDSRSDIDLSREQSVLLTRPQTQVLIQVITRPQSAFFQNILEGRSLETAIGSAMQAGQVTGQGFDPAEAIGLMLESGFCSDIDTDQTLNH